MTTLHRKLLPLAAAFALNMFDGAAEKITGVRYAVPVERYGHFALRRPQEYASLMATTDAGRELALELPQDEVFENIVPRLVRLAAGEPEEILTIVSGRRICARLVMVSLRGGALTISAKSQPISTPMRWLNPVGVVDLDGDGRTEIAAVITPHNGGTLKVQKSQPDLADSVRPVEDSTQTRCWVSTSVDIEKSCLLKRFSLLAM